MFNDRLQFETPVCGELNLGRETTENRLTIPRSKNQRVLESRETPVPVYYSSENSNVTPSLLLSVSLTENEDLYHLN